MNRQEKNYNPNNFNAVHSALAYLLFFVALIGISYLSVPLEKYIRANFNVKDSLPAQCVESLLLSLSFGLIVLILSVFSHVNPVQSGGYLRQKGQGTDKLMAVVGICGLSVLFTPLAEQMSLDFQFLGSYFNRGNGLGAIVEDEDYQSTGWLLFYVFVCLPLLPAIFEELLFRGVVLRGLTQFGKTTAVIVSAVMFALAHGNTDQIIYQFFGGLVFGFLFVETKNLTVSMCAHFANNAFAVVFAIVKEMALERKHSPLVYSSITEIFGVFLATVCIVSAIVYFGRRMVKTQKDGGKQPTLLTAKFSKTNGFGEETVQAIPWYETGELTNEASVYIRAKKKGKLNKKANATLACILLSVGIAFGLVLEILSIIY